MSRTHRPSTARNRPVHANRFDDPAGGRSQDWASLLRRSFQVDVLECAKCGGRLRVLGEITEPAMVSG